MAYKRKIQVRRGAASDRPTLSSGEFGLDTDTGSEAVWIGTPAGNKQIAMGSGSGTPEYVALVLLDNPASIVTVLKNTLTGTPSLTLTRDTTGLFSVRFPSSTFVNGKATLNGCINRDGSTSLQIADPVYCYVGVAGDTSTTGWSMFTADPLTPGSNVDYPVYWVLEIKDYQ
jgi:hypothetical protein